MPSRVLRLPEGLNSSSLNIQDQKALIQATTCDRDLSHQPCPRLTRANRPRQCLPRRRVLHTSRNPPALGWTEFIEQRSATGAQHLIIHQPNASRGEQLAGAQQGFGFGHPLVQVAVKLHEECRCHHVIDIPEGANRAASSRLQRQSCKTQFTVLVTQEGATGTEHHRSNG